MKSLNLDWIKQDAGRRLQLTEKIEELQSLVSELYPGHKVLIEMPETVPFPKATDFVQSSIFPPLPQAIHQWGESLTGIEKMEHVLKSAPLSSRDLHKTLNSLGADISMGTVMSNLSRKKELFRKTANGKWELIKSREENRESP